MKKVVFCVFRFTVIDDTGLFIKYYQMIILILQFFSLTL